MCELIKTIIRTDKGFKEVHLVSVSKALFEHCGAEVTSNQVYNHLRKWRMRWIHISMLRDLSGAQWDKDSCTIVLEADHYQGHVKDVAQAIRENKPTDVHPYLYKAIMDVLEYSPDALMAALNHLVDHKAQGITFVEMADSHRSL
jgi:methionine salvage enolase-phosphatase E1